MADHCDCCGGNKRRTSAPATKAVSRLWRTASCPNPFSSAPTTQPEPPVLGPVRTPSRTVEFDATIEKVVEEGRKTMAGSGRTVVLPPLPSMSTVAAAPSSSPPEKKSPAKVTKKEGEKDGNTKKQKQQGRQQEVEEVEVEEEEGDQDDDGDGVTYTVSFRCKCGAAHEFSFRKA